MNTHEIENLISTCDFSRGTDIFANKVLYQALSVLGQGDGGTVLDDSEIEMLAAAGTVEIEHGNLLV